MIVVTGANGQLGRFVINGLLATMPANEVVAAVRSPGKASDLASLGVALREADYNRPETLTLAFRGASKLLLISSSEVGQRVTQHKAVIDAAKMANVDLLVYTSMLHADSSLLMLAGEHKATEALIKESGLSYVILRNGWYVENYAGFIPSALEQGALIGCAGEGKISCAARADYAAAAVAALTGKASMNSTYELAGDTAYTLSDFAAELARQSGKPIQYVNMEKADYIAALVKVGMPEGFAAILADSDIGASQGGLFDVSADLTRLIGRPTTRLAEAIKAALQNN